MLVKMAVNGYEVKIADLVRTLDPETVWQINNYYPHTANVQAGDGVTIADVPCDEYEQIPGILEAIITEFMRLRDRGDVHAVVLDLPSESKMRPRYYNAGSNDLISFFLEHPDLHPCAAHIYPYLYRAGKKGAAIDDLYKAREYLNRWIEHEEKRDSR